MLGDWGLFCAILGREEQAMALPRPEVAGSGFRLRIQRCESVGAPCVLAGSRRSSEGAARATCGAVLPLWLLGVWASQDPVEASHSEID